MGIFERATNLSAALEFYNNKQYLDAYVIYKSLYEDDKNDYETTHNIIKCIISGNIEDDLIYYLNIVVNAGQANKTEIKYYYEIMRILGNQAAIEDLFNLYKDAYKKCQLNYVSLEALMDLKEYEEAIKCCEDLRIIMGKARGFDNNTYYTHMCRILIEIGDKQRLYDELSRALFEDKVYLVYLLKSFKDVCMEHGHIDESLQAYRMVLKRNKYAIWLSYDLIELLLYMGLAEEADEERKRITNIVEFKCKNNTDSKEKLALLEYLIKISSRMGEEKTIESICNDLSIDIESILNQPEIIADQSIKDTINLCETKALMRKVSKMNKLIRTYYKMFTSDLREIENAKIIFASVLGNISRKFSKLFENDDFEVYDYTLFYNVFSFYELNSFSESEINQILSLLRNIRDITIQLNPSVNKRTFNVNEYLINVLSLKTSITLKNKVLTYKVTDSDGAQLTMFGMILLLCTFLDSDEKEAFAFELTSGDTELLREILKQLFKLIPSATPLNKMLGEEKECRDSKIFMQLVYTKEIIKLLFNVEKDIIEEQQLLDDNIPNKGCMTLKNLLELKYREESDVINNLCMLNDIVYKGVFVGDEYEGENISISYIVALASKCRDSVSNNKIFQNFINNFLIACLNRKYYTYLKHKIYSLKGDSFLIKEADFYDKLIFKSKYIFTEVDESYLDSQASLKLLTYTDYTQKEEFMHLFGAEIIKWSKLTIIFYQVDLEKCIWKIDNKEYLQNIKINQTDDNIIVEGINGFSFLGWKKSIMANSSLAKIIRRTAVYK